MKILHTYCLNYNIGDYALGIGVKNLVRRYLPVDFIAETNLQGTVFNEYYIDNVVNKKYDLLVIGGGGIIHGSHWPNGWFWLIEERLIERINIPFIVYGVGYNYFKNEGGMPEIGKRHLKKTIEASTYFSVRNDGSLERLSDQLGITVPVIPDPGFHINMGRSYSCNESSPFIIVQLANDKPIHRFGSEANRDIFVDQMRIVVRNIAKSYKVIFAPHVFEDVSLSEEIADGIPNTKIWEFSKYAFDRCSECLGYYDKAEFVIAMRGHGQIIPIAFNTPVISIENHPKHVGLMKKLDIDFYNVTIQDDGFAKRIILKISELEKNRNIYIEKLNRINSDLALGSETAFEEIRRRIFNIAK